MAEGASSTKLPPRPPDPGMRSPIVLAKDLIMRSNPSDKLAALTNALKSITRSAELFKAKSQEAQEREKRARAAVARVREAKRQKAAVDGARKMEICRRLKAEMNRNRALEKEIGTLGIQLAVQQRKRKRREDAEREDKAHKRQRVEDAGSATLAAISELRAEQRDLRELAAAGMTHGVALAAQTREFMAQQAAEVADMRAAYQSLEREVSRAKEYGNAARRELAELEAATAGLRSTTAQLRDRLVGEQKERRRLHRALQEIRGNISCVCRVRPIRGVDVPQLSSTSGATAKQLEAALCIFDKERVSIQATQPAAAAGLGGAGRLGRTRTFLFDRVLGDDASQSDVFRHVEGIVGAAIDGHNCTVMCYGQTGSGKTHTMLGTASHPGIVPRAGEALVRMIAERGAAHTLQVSVLELYNNRCYDMMTATGKALPVTASGSSGGGAVVNGLTLRAVETADELVTAVADACSSRRVSATEMNEHSSRSHCIVTIEVLRLGRGGRSSKLHLVDLGGSECSAKSGVFKGVHLQEASFVNKSLSALGDVLLALKTKAAHTPYRNSKLTHILQDSIGGDARMMLIVNVTPDPRQLAETLHVLSFGVQASGVERKKAAAAAAASRKEGVK